MAGVFAATSFAVFLVLTFVAWRRYLWAAERGPHDKTDTCPYSLTDVFGDRHLVNVPHQAGIQWLTEVFSRSAERFPHLTALQIPHTGESLTFAELEARAEDVAAALSPFLTGPDQVVAVAMSQDNWQIVASHLGILKAGGTVVFLDTTLPDALITHMLNDAQPVVILTRGQGNFRDLPTLDVMALDDAFHMGIANLTGNRRLAAAIKRLLREAMRLRFTDPHESPEGMLSEGHTTGAILEAVGKGKATTARQLMLEHIEQSKERGLAGLLNPLPGTKIHVRGR